MESTIEKYLDGTGVTEEELDNAIGKLDYEDIRELLKRLKDFISNQ
jgi:hypothetical protein|tara:strand:+ start:4166 stop:4303 length:138 start_codon:yes stop_codon:yes gene_type:complete